MTALESHDSLETVAVLHEIKSSQLFAGTLADVALFTHYMSHINYSAKLKYFNQSVKFDLKPPETESVAVKKKKNSTRPIVSPPACMAPVAQHSVSRNDITDCKGE